MRRILASPNTSTAYAGGGDASEVVAIERRVQGDVARMLYSNAGGGLVMTGLIALFLVFVIGPAVADSSRFWLVALFAVLSVRAVDVLRWHPQRVARGASGQIDLLCFAAGSLCACAVWAMFPLLFFPVLGQSRSIAAFVVMAAMAGGSTLVLGPSRLLCNAYCAVQLLVPALVYLSLPGNDNAVLSLLAVATFLFMSVCSHQANRSITGALRLSRLNEALVAQSERQREETDAVNRRLIATQDALRHANQALERRVERQTLHLTREAARRQAYVTALARLGSTDPLTSLDNRASFTRRLGDMLLDAAATGTQLAVLFLDIDNFKQINGVRGHSAGDALLLRAARTLAETVGDLAELARWGGDEFIIAQHATSRAGAAALGCRLREALLRPLAEPHARTCLGVTIGIALYPEDGTTQDDLIRAAGVAMFQAKTQGKGRIGQFDPDLARDLTRRHVLEQALRGAAERGEFSLAFQPIFDSATGRCHAVETLLRWHHPELGTVEPILAIEAAEQSGQIAGIGRWVLQQACRTAASWPQTAPGCAPAVTVNVSVAQVQSGTLIEDVATALAQSGLPPERLQIEITESMFVADPLGIAPVFAALRRRGHKILLDDFGTGYSSLAYLRKLPLDVIKVDRSFVAAAEREGYAIVRAILSIARALSLAVTAEGVETDAQRAALTSMGVDNLQGYLLSRPMTEAAFAAWLQSERQAVPCEPW